MLVFFKNIDIVSLRRVLSVLPTEPTWTSTFPSSNSSQSRHLLIFRRSSHVKTPRESHFFTGTYAGGNIFVNKLYPLQIPSRRNIRLQFLISSYISNLLCHSDALLDWDHEDRIFNSSRFRVYLFSSEWHERRYVKIWTLFNNEK